MNTELEKFKALPDDVLATAINILTNNWYEDYSDNRAASEMRSVLDGRSNHARPIANYMSCIDFMRIALAESEKEASNG